MKRIILSVGILLMMGSVGVLSAQTFSEFFKQKKTQQKYLLEQIAAMQAYTQLAKKGYSLVSGGLDLIGDIKNGKFNLDKDYFNGLHAAGVMNEITDKPAACQKIYAGIRQLYHQANSAFQSSDIASSEKDYIYRV